MKRKYIVPLVLPLFIAWGCKDELPINGGVPAEQGDEVEFSYAAAPSSRTVYQQNWDGENYNQEIFWGDYMEKTKVDTVMIFCPEAARKIGRYGVTPQADQSNVAATIVKMGEAGVQWGDKSATHNFFAFYPAAHVRSQEMTKETLNGTDSYWVNVTLDYGQAPVKFIGWQGENPNFNNEPTYDFLYKAPRTDYPDGSLAGHESERITWFGLPDMKNAIMVARTPVGEAGYGQPVPLNFQVVADVLDLTINGPITPNELNGKDTPGKHILINSVTVRVTDEAKSAVKAITGNFKIDILNGKCVPEGTQQSIQLTTAGHRPAGDTNPGPLYPALFVRSDKTPTSANASSVVDQLRLRAFLIPGQVTNLNQLEVVVSTNFGEYTKPLSAISGEWVSGQIHKVKLPHFQYEGTPFDFKNWMAQLDPNIYLSEISIPGTWHTSVEMYQGTGNNNYKTQYEAGIRAFEVHTYGHYVGETQTPGETTWGGYGAVSVRTESTGIGRRNVVYTRTATGTLNVDVKNEYTLLNTSTGNNVVNGISSISELMNPSAFAFIELGMEYNAGDDDNASYSYYPDGSYAATRTRTQTYTISQSLGFGWPDYPAADSEEIANIFASGENVTTTESDPAITVAKTTAGTGEKWANAVQYALKELAAKPNKNNGNPMIVTKEITRATTLGDVASQILVKINTNGVDNGIDAAGNSKWKDGTTALFSRWIGGSGEMPLTVNLKWGQAVLPGVEVNGEQQGVLGTSDEDLRWCYTEIEKVITSGTTTGEYVLLANRKTGLDNIGNAIYNNYSLGKHRTYYEIGIGGYLDDYNETGCQNLATQLNPYLLNMMTKPDRRMIPFGIVLMNYALDDTYYGPQLIRAIINNNNAFRLNRRPTATPSADSKTNASYASETRPPLKP